MAAELSRKNEEHKTMITSQEFIPAQAHLNIVTSKELTKELRDIIEEEFENDLILYYYSDIGSVLQFTLTKEMWITDCKKSFVNVDLPLIPVVANKGNNHMHWIEWIKIINIKSQNICVGISLKLNEKNNKWIVQSICLDKGDIYNKHFLVGFKSGQRNYKCANFKTSIAQIKITDRTINNYAVNRNMIVQNEEQPIIDDEEDNEINEAVVVEDKEYDKDKEDDETINHTPGMYTIRQDMKEFVDVKEDIDVLKQQIQSQQDAIVRLKELLRAKNANNAHQKSSQQDAIGSDICDLWLDEIIDSVIKAYKTIGTKRNMYTCIDKQSTRLWMEYVLSKFNDESMMYYWLGYTTAMQMTLLRKKIIKSDLNKINWSNLKLFKSQSTNNDPINKSVTITQQVMKEYCNVALERLNNLIPIVAIDKHNNNYSIEWILIVNIIHTNCNVGISFKYVETYDTFTATAIYLDKDEIESKHKLFEPTSDDCKHLHSFNIVEFKFESNSTSMRNQTVGDIREEVVKYKIAFELAEQKTQQLRQQMVQIKKMNPNWRDQMNQYLLQQQQQQTFHINLVVYKHKSSSK